MVNETLVWASATLGPGNQAAEFNNANNGSINHDVGNTTVNARLIQTGDESPGEQDGLGLDSGEVDTGGNYAFGGVQNSALWLDNSLISLDPNTVAVQLSFSTQNTSLFKDGAQNVNFWISDMDQLLYRDEIIITAIGLDGNPVPVTITDIGSNMGVTGNGTDTATITVPEDGIVTANTDAAGAFRVYVAGPVLSVTISYRNLETAYQSVQISDINFDTVPADILPCFVAGTRIRTLNGDCPVEALQIGDMVMTRDHGPQPIRWIGKRKVAALGDKFSPVEIAAGILGNSRPLLVSPEHRLILDGAEVALLFGEAEVLVAARSLIDDETVFRREGGEVIYVHILFDRHELIWAEDCLAESFHPGDSATDGMDGDTRAEILALFPELEAGIAAYGPTARICLKPAEAQLLMQ